MEVAGVWSLLEVEDELYVDDGEDDEEAEKVSIVDAGETSRDEAGDGNKDNR